MINTLRNKIDNLKSSSFITYGILTITFLMYFILSINGGSENTMTLVRYGAKVNELIYLGEWWRLITPVFLHIGFAHLVLNSLIIYFLGSEVEMIIGHFRYFILYLASGILGNLASFALNNSISAGASTAIFGIFASTIVLANLYPYHTGIQLLSRNYLILIVLNVVFGFFSPGTDNAGHIGGLLAGYLVMYALSSKNALNNPRKKRFLYAMAYVIIFIILLVVGYLKVQRMYMT